jgi:hypothetical protein
MALLHEYKETLRRIKRFAGNAEYRLTVTWRSVDERQLLKSYIRRHFGLVVLERVHFYNSFIVTVRVGQIRPIPRQRTAWNVPASSAVSHGRDRAVVRAPAIPRDEGSHWLIQAAAEGIPNGQLSEVWGFGDGTRVHRQSRL